jgi:hypothetical protein
MLNIYKVLYQTYWIMKKDSKETGKIRIGMQDDSLGRDPKFILIIHEMVYLLKRNLASTHLGRYGDS